MGCLDFAGDIAKIGGMEEQAKKQLYDMSKIARSIGQGSLQKSKDAEHPRDYTTPEGTMQKYPSSHTWANRKKQKQRVDEREGKESEDGLPCDQRRYNEKNIPMLVKIRYVKTTVMNAFLFAV